MPRTAASRPPGQLKPETAQHLPQRQGAPQIAGAQALGLLGERHRPAPRVRAAEPAHRQCDQQRPAARRAVCQQPLVAAVHPRRLLPAPRAPRQGAPDRREDHHRIPGVGHPADLQPGKVREQHRQQGRSPLGHLQAANGAIAVCQRRRHDKMKRQRGSRAKRSWQTSASYRSLAAIPRRHAAPAPDRDEPAPGRYSAQPITKLAEEPYFVKVPGWLRTGRGGLPVIGCLPCEVSGLLVVRRLSKPAVLPGVRLCHCRRVMCACHARVALSWGFSCRTWPGSSSRAS